MSSAPPDFDRVARAIGALNALRPPPLRAGRLQVRYLHWGVTPPGYWQSRRHPNPCETHKHSFFEVCHALTGRGAFRTFAPDTRQPVRAGDTFFARPALLHHYGSDERDTLGICFWAFSIERAGRGARALDSAQAATLAAFAASAQTFIGADARTHAALELLFAEALERPPHRARLLPLLEYLALQLASAASEHPGAPSSIEERAQSAGGAAGPNLWRIHQYVQDHCHRDLQLSEIAARCGYSERHFARLFAATFGESFTDYLTRARMETAAHLLLDNSFPLKQVARKSGFGSLAAFVRAFKRHFAITPGAYRDRSLGAAK